jgi:hypothetical protein
MSNSSRRARPARGESGGKHRRLLKLAPAAIAILATVALIGSGVMLEGRPLDPRTDCPLAGDPAHVQVIALDTTDQLLRDQPRLVDRAVDGVVSNVSAGDRLAVAEIREGGLEQDLLFNRCAPGQGSNVERNRLRDAVRVPIGSALETLATRPQARQSPIIESLIALVDHPDLQPTRGRLTIELLTDGLQLSSFASAYSGQPFPPPQRGLLNGVTIHLVVLHNARDAGRQQRGVEMLVAWLRDSGARVEHDPFTWERFAGATR